MTDEEEDEDDEGSVEVEVARPKDSLEVLKKMRGRMKVGVSLTSGVSQVESCRDE